MELEDLAPVYALGCKLFTAERWPTLYRTWDQYELIEFFASDEETCLVAELDGRLVGFILGTLIEKARSAWTYGWVVWLGVDTSSARAGIGQRLLDRLTERFRADGARILLADTAANNDAAMSFFRQAGFDQIEKHVYMSKNLAKEDRAASAPGKAVTAATKKDDSTRVRRQTRRVPAGGRRRPNRKGGSAD